MPTTPVTEVTYVVELDNGEPDTQATVRAILNHYDLDTDYGYIEPKTVISHSDAEGKGSLFLWPNARGSTGSWYEVSVDGQEKTLSLQATIPAEGPIKLQLASTMPPYPPESSIIQAVADTAENAGKAAASAVEAKGYSDAAKASADAAGAAAAGVAADADRASQAADTATQAATTAATDAVAAVQGELNDETAASGANAAAAQAAAAAALTSETNSRTSETAAAGSAQAAHDSELAAQTAASTAHDSQVAAAGSADAAAGSATGAGESATTATDAAAAAQGSAAAAGNSATLADQSEQNSSGYADTALDYLGQMTMALAIMLGYMNDATGAVSLAQQYAAQAASVAQQDLSGVVNQPLYRSPNAVLGTFTHDITRDKDGGAWIERCADKSWANEQLNGAYLAMTSMDGFQAELDARSRGATVGAEVNPDPNFANPAGWTLDAGAAVTGGKLVFTATAVGNGASRGDPVGGAMSLQPYMVTIVVDSLTAGGAISFRFGTTGGQVRLLTMPGTYTFAVVPAAAGSVIKLAAANAATTAVVSKLSIARITALNTGPTNYFQLATDGKYYKLNKNLAPWTENLLNNWNKSGAPVIVPSAGFVGGIAAESFSTNAAGVGVFRSGLVTQSLGVGEVYGAQMRIKHVSGDSTTRIRLEGTAYPTPVGVAINPVDGSWVAATGGIAPNNVTVTATADGGWFVSFTSPTQVSGTVNLSIYSQNAAARTALITGVQVERGLPTSYEPKLTADLGITETFRGNSPKYPRIPHVVWEAANATIFDLGAVGRPMWMRFVATPVSAGAATSGAITSSVAGSITSVVLGNGKMLISRSGDTSNVHGCNEVDFIRDSTNWYAKYTGASFGALVGGGCGCRIRGTIADRNTLRPTQPDAAFAIGGSGGVNAVAMTVLPEAPFDPVTGLQVLTIGLAVGTGNAGVLGSVVMNDGSVVTYSQASNDGSSVAFTPRGDVLWGLSNATTLFAMPLSTTNVANTGSVARQYGTTTSPNGGQGITKRLAPGGGMIGAYGVGWNMLTYLRENVTTPAATLVAQLSGAHNTGVMVGDVRRMVMSSTAAGAIVSGAVVLGAMGTPAGFDSVISNVSATGFTETFATTQVRGYVNLPVTTPGQSFTFTVTYAGAALGAFYINNQANGAGVSTAIASNVAAGTYTFQFNVPSTNCSLLFVASNTFTVSNLVVQPGVVDYSYKAKPANIVTGVTLTPVAAAAQLAGWGNFKNNSATMYGVENIVNGTFAANINSWNWATSGGSVAWSPTNGGSARINGDGISHYSRISQTISTVPGYSYRLMFDLYSFPVLVDVSSATDPPPFATLGGDIKAQTQYNPGLGQIIDFVATKAYACVNFQKLETDQAFLDNISIKQTTIVAGFLQEPSFSADLDTGTGIRRTSAWVNTTGYGPGNFIPRSAWTGAVNGIIGSGGTITPGMVLVGLPAGVNATITKSTDVASGFEVLDLQLSGNAAAGGNVYLYFSGTAANIPAASGQTWTGSVYSQLQAGTLTNISGTNLNIEETNGSTYLVGNSTPLNTGAGPINTQRVTVSRTTNNATINAIRTNAQVSIAGAGPLDVTIRLAVPQLERGATAGLPIATTGAAFNGIAAIYYRGATAGSYYTAGVDANGMFAAEMYDGATTRRATSTTFVSNGVWRKVAEEYDGAGTISLRVDAVPVGSATGAALLTMNNASALMTYGNNFAITAAFPGQIALFHFGVTQMSLPAEQWAYELERAMFKPGAQVTLPDFGVVIGLSYDDKLAQSRVVTATGETGFNGLVRSSAVTTPTSGSFASETQQMGIRSVVRTGGAVDITIPAQDLKAELARRAEDAMRAERNTGRLFNYDATASQTDFLLPVGWEAIGVNAARQAQREGATKDYVRKFDGFRETVSFLTGQAVNTWVQVSARRAA